MTEAQGRTTPDHPPRGNAGAVVQPPPSKQASKAFWQMMRRTVAMAGCVDLLFFALFMYIGVPELAWPNVSSVALYGTAYWLIRQRFNAAAIVLIWVEVVLHAAAGTLLIGWDSGFHYYLLLFVPAIVVGSKVSYARVLLLLLFVCYVSLDAVSYFFNPINPIPVLELALVRWVNIAVVFAMFAHAAACYRLWVLRTNERAHGQVSEAVRRADRALRLSKRQGRDSVTSESTPDH